jgi:hypothetical protein
MKNELVLHIGVKKSPVVDLVVPVKGGRKDQLVLITDPVERLMINNTL